ncbi:hypothetical protein BDZ91DRAFT_741163 [Kalaharituber pfeilii]|nr:hypothetical protein BDZ91DRAFT_741163 [Kalaharituber pfeilii]
MFRILLADFTPPVSLSIRYAHLHHSVKSNFVAPDFCNPNSRRLDIGIRLDCRESSMQGQNLKCTMESEE